MVRRDALHLSHQLPMALLPDRHPTWIWVSARVAALAGQRRLGAGHDRPRRDRANPPGSRANALDGMIDAQTVRGARKGPTFHQAGGPGDRTVGTKRTLLRGNPRAAPSPPGPTAPPSASASTKCPSWRPSWVTAPTAGLLALARARAPRHQGPTPRRHRLHPAPAAPQDGAHHRPAGRWRRLSRCYEGFEVSARARLEPLRVGYIAWRPVA